MRKGEKTQVWGALSQPRITRLQGLQEWERTFVGWIISWVNASLSGWLISSLIIGKLIGWLTDLNHLLACSLIG